MVTAQLAFTNNSGFFYFFCFHNKYSFAFYLLRRPLALLYQVFRPMSRLLTLFFVKIFLWSIRILTSLNKLW